MNRRPVIPCSSLSELQHTPPAPEREAAEMPERERRSFREFVKELRHPEIAVGGGLAAAVLLGLLVYQAFAPVALGDVMVEAWGLLFDAVLFGFLLVWVNVRRAKKDQIERYVEELEDYRRLETEAGSARSAGILVRLAKSGGGGPCAGGNVSCESGPPRGGPQRGEPQPGGSPRGAPLQGGPRRGIPPRGEPLRGGPRRGALQRGGPQRGAPPRGGPQRGPGPRAVATRFCAGGQEHEATRWPPSP